MLGEPGEGFRLVLQTLATFRVSVAGAAVGLAQAALDEAAAAHRGAASSSGRRSPGWARCRSCSRTSWMDIESARALTYAAAAARPPGPAGAAWTWSSMAKVAATEAAGRVVDRCRAGDGPVRAGRGAA